MCGRFFKSEAQKSEGTVAPPRGRLGLAIWSAFFASMTTAGAYLRVPLPWVPVTLQTLFVLLSGLVLPPKWAAASQVVYLLVGLAGLPVFAGGAGMSAILSPTFGYLLSFPFAAWLVAHLTRGHHTLGHDASVCFVASGLILLVGSVYLMAIARAVLDQPLGFRTAMLVGFAVFLPGEILKSLIAALVARRLRAAMES